MKNDLKTENNRFAIPHKINPCPETGDIPVLMYNNTFEFVVLAKVDEDGTYLFVCDHTTPDEENIASMIEKWNDHTLKSIWSDVAVRRHLMGHLNYQLVEEKSSAILQHYPSLEDAKRAKELYENRFGEKCVIAMMYENNLHLCLYPEEKVD